MSMKIGEFDSLEVSFDAYLKGEKDRYLSDNREEDEL